MIVDAILRIFQKDPTVKRHLLKTVSWRVIGSIDTFLLGWFVTGKIDLGAKIGGLELFTKMLLYFTHERIWHKIKFGIPTRLFKAENVKRVNAQHLFPQTSKISRKQKEELNNSQSFTVWLTGLSSSGKSSIAVELDNWFFSNGLRSYVIDGDNTRLGINSDLSFSQEDRSENIRRVAEICRLFNEAGDIVIASFISPFANDRKAAEIIIGEDSFLEIFVDASIETCKIRDTKGLYLKAEQGEIKNFTGISSPYEAPVSPSLHLHSDKETIESSVEKVVSHLIKQNKLALQKVSSTII